MSNRNVLKNNNLCWFKQPEKKEDSRKSDAPPAAQNHHKCLKDPTETRTDRFPVTSPEDDWRSSRSGTNLSELRIKESPQQVMLRIRGLEIITPPPHQSDLRVRAAWTPADRQTRVQV